jgi:hypothetical protein
MISSVRIKYLPDGSDTAPLVLDDADRQAENDDFMFNLGLGLTGGGGVLSLIMFLLARRRQTSMPAPAE